MSTVALSVSCPNLIFCVHTTINADFAMSTGARAAVIMTLPLDHGLQAAVLSLDWRSYLRVRMPTLLAHHLIVVPPAFSSILVSCYT